MSSSIRMCFYFGLLAQLLGSGPLFAQGSAISIRNVPDGLYEINGSFETNAPLAMVWDLLSDYDRLKGTVTGLVQSKVLERKGDKLLVEQEARGSFLFFSRSVHVRLSILESKPRSITFEDVSKLDFEVYRGSWQIEPLAGGGVQVRYQLFASRGQFAPEALEQHIFKGQAGTLLSQLRERLELMAAVAPGPLAQATP